MRCPAGLPPSTFPFCSACVKSLCPYNTGFRLVAADAYRDDGFNDDDDAVSFVSFGDICDAIMPDPRVDANWKAKGRAMHNDSIQN